MAINLQKGQRVSLDKGLNLALVGLGWDTNRYDGGNDFDLDASAFLLGDGNKLLKDEDFVFYNNPKHSSGAVHHTGDNRTGDGDGDDETIIINFSKVPSNISKIAIVVTIHDAEARRQNFGQVDNAYIRVAKIDDEFDSVGTPVLRFDLTEEFSIETAIVVAEFYKKNNSWNFNAVASGYKGGLAAICQNYGANV